MSTAKYHFDNRYSALVTVNGNYVLTQAGDLNCNPDYEVGEHVQNVHEITYVVSGSGTMWINGERIPLRPRMAVVNRIGDRHNIATGSGETLRYFYLGFEFGAGKESGATGVLKRFFEETEHRVVCEASTLQDAFIGLFNELLFRDEVSDVMLESCLNRIICGCCRMFGGADARGYRLGDSSTVDRRLVYDVVHYIDSNASEGGLLARLSGEFGYSYDYIARRFAAVTGGSLRDYYNERRFERACSELARGARVTDVAEMLGYRSIHAFSAAFKKRKGVSPREYLPENEQPAQNMK